jgi:hypothetical protein
MIEKPDVSISCYANSAGSVFKGPSGGLPASTTKFFFAKLATSDFCSLFWRGSIFDFFDIIGRQQVSEPLARRVALRRPLTARYLGHSQQCAC